MTSTESSLSDLEARLHRAIREGDNLNVRKLLRRGAPVQSYFLDQAAVQGNVLVVQALLEHASHAFKQHDLQSTLINAIVSGNAGVVEQLLDSVDPNFHATHERDTPLSLCVQADHSVQALQILLRAGANVHSVDINGATPLHHACRDAHVNQARLLVESGANPNLRDFQGNTPLHKAVRAGNLDIVQIMIEEGHGDMNLTNNVHETPLSIAMEYHLVAMVEWLLTNRSPPAEHLFLWVAALRNLPVRGRLRPSNLIEWDLDPFQVDSRGYTIAHRIIEISTSGDANDDDNDDDKVANDYRMDFLDQLFQQAPKLLQSAMNTSILSAMHLAAARNQVRAVEILIKHGAPTRSHDAQGLTPFMVAAKHGHCDVTATLLCHVDNALLLTDVDSRHGQTALHWAVMGHHETVVVHLLQAGASTRELNSGGLSPLHLLHADAIDHSRSMTLNDESVRDKCEKTRRRLGVLKVLLKYGADAMLPDSQGDLPWFSPAFNHQLDDSFLLLHAAAIQGLFEAQRRLRQSDGHEKRKLDGAIDALGKRAKQLLLCSTDAVSK